MHSSNENNQTNTNNQLFPNISLQRPNFFYADDNAEEIELSSRKKTILNESNSVKKLLHVESKKNNLFTEEVESNHEYSVKKDNNVSSQLTETDLKESYGKE